MVPASGSGPASKKRKLTPTPNNNEMALNPYQPHKIPVDDLKHWNVFRFLCPKDELILDRVQYAYVYGNSKFKKGLIVTDNSVYTTVPNVTSSTKLSLIPELCGKDVIELHAGTKSFLLALTQNGSVYSWGTNSHGRLGIGTNRNTFLPKQVTGSLTEKKVIQLAASSQHVLALTDDGEVHGWGANAGGELGLIPFGDEVSVTESGEDQRAPVLLACLPFCEEKIVKIAAATSVSAGLTESGLLFQWGNGDSIPIKVADPMKFKQLACSQRQILALSVEGSVYALTNGTPNIILADSKKIAINIAGDPKLDIFGVEFYHGIEMLVFGDSPQDWSFSPTHFKTMDIAFASIAQQTYRTLRSCCGGVGGAASVGQNIASLLNNENHYSDITFSVEEKLIYAHKSILTVRTPYFERMFKSHWAESKETTITIPETKYAAFNALINYIYTDKITFSETEYENLFDLMQLADSYCEFHIRRKCEKMLLANLTVDNACFLLRNAPSANATELEDRALNFIVDHRKEILSLVSKEDSDLGAVLGQNALEKLTRALVERF